MKVKIKNFNIDKIMNSGQIFRLYKDDKNIYHLFHDDRHLKITTSDFVNYEFSCQKPTFNTFYKKYFDLNTNYESIKPLKTNKFLKNCIEYGRGIRILKQSPYEMLISFIISQRKSIPAIRTSIERLCKYCGKKMDSYYAFPSPKEILKNKNKLSKCGLGYRVPYIIDACEKIISREIDLSRDDMSIECLMKIKGVGVKVASCVMLFAYHDIKTFPIDVWISRVLQKYYNGIMPREYEKYAGIIQQYLFYYAKDRKVF